MRYVPRVEFSKISHRRRNVIEFWINAEEFYNWKIRFHFVEKRPWKDSRNINYEWYLDMEFYNHGGWSVYENNGRGRGSRYVQRETIRKSHAALRLQRRNRGNRRKRRRSRRAAEHVVNWRTSSRRRWDHWIDMSRGGSLKFSPLPPFPPPRRRCSLSETSTLCPGVDR